MPRSKVDRVMRSMRLPTEIDKVFVKKAKAQRISINEAVEQAVLMWVSRR